MLLSSTLSVAGEAPSQRSVSGKIRPPRAEPQTRASFARVRQPRYWCCPQPRAFPGATVSAEEEDLSPSHFVDQGGRARARGALESADASPRDRQEDETYRKGAAAKGGDSRHWSRP